jgi:hypothetical protein
MNRRTTLTLTGVALLGLALGALPQLASGQQSDPLLGLWQLNVAKSKYSPGPAPKSQTIYVQGEGQNRKATTAGIDAQGNPQAAVFIHIYDGQPHPTTAVAGTLAFDASAYTRADANTLNWTRTKAGKVVQTGTTVVSPDGKTYTVSTTGTDASGQQIRTIAVYDRQ